jgi:hypothetical protein
MCLTPDEYHQLRPKLNERPQLLLFAANTTREAQTPELERITPECE